MRTLDSTPIRPCMTPVEAAEYLGCNPQYLRIQAREHPERLGFPVVCIGQRVRIPRAPFMKFIGLDG